MIKVQKIAGERPALVQVGSTLVTFDADGFAEVTEEVASTLDLIPREFTRVEAEPTKAAPAPSAAEASEVQGSAEPAIPAAPKRKAPSIKK